MPINVFIADDHPIVIIGFKKVLEFHHEINVAGTFTSGKALLKELETNRPDVLILDLQMPEMNGYDLTGIIAQQYPSVKILILTNVDNISSIRRTIAAGASGYALKTIGEDMLVQAIISVCNDQKFIDPDLQASLMQYALGDKNVINVPTAITRREKEILQLVAQNLSSQEIANQLHLSKRTVDNHRQNLLLKLEAKNSLHLITKAMDLGLIN
ncbi:response regulator [Chitinophagaceae bacterium MMS25-I14]